MAFNPQLSDPQDVSRAIAPVQDKSIATAISGISDILDAGANIYAKQAKQQADELKLKQKEADAQDSALFRQQTQEMSERLTNEFRSKAGRLKKTNQADIRLESLYKQYADKNPDKASEYLKIMREVTGRNVAGAELKSELDAAQEYQNNLEKQRTQFVNDAVSLGIPLHQVDTAEGASLYVARSEKRSQLFQQQQRLQFATDQRKLDQLDSANELGSFGINSYHDSAAKAEALVQQITGKTYEELSDTDIKDLDPQKLDLLRASIQGQKDAVLLDANKAFSRFDNLTPAQINQTVKPALDRLDSMLTRINLETTKDNAKNRAELDRAALMANLSGTELGTIMALNPNLLKFNLSTTDSAKYLKELAEYAQGKPLDTGDKGSVRSTVVTLEDAIGNGSTDIPEIKNLVDSIRKGNLSNFDDMSGKQRADMFEAMKNDKVLDLIRNSNDRAVDVLVKNADEFAYQLIVSVAADINDELGRRPMRAPLGSDKRSTKDFIDLSVDSTGIKFSAKPGFTGEDRKIAMQTANDFTRLWGNKLNNALHVKSKLDGVSLEQNAKILIDNTPRLKSLMEEAE